MRSIRLTVIVLISLTLAAQSSKPPAAARHDFRETFHGVELNDPYHWLEDFNSPDAAAWIDAQDHAARAALAASPGQDYIRKRLSELMKYDRISAPEEAGGRYFFTRSPAEAKRPLLCYRDGLNGAEHTWLDPASVNSDTSVTFQLLDVSRDGKLVAYSIRQSGQDEVEVRLHRLDSLYDTDMLPKSLYGSVSLLPTNAGYYYARRSREKGSRIFFHQVGDDGSREREVFGEGLDARVFLGTHVSRDGRWLIITASYGWSRNEIYFQDLKTGSPVRKLVAGIEDQFRPHEAGPGLLLITTTWKAPKGRALLVNLEQPDMDHWREIIPPAEDTLDTAAVIGGRIYAHYTHNVQTRIRIFTLDGKPEGEVSLPEAALANLSGDWNRPEAFLGLQTFTAPYRIERLDTNTGARAPWFEPNLPFRAEDYEVKQVWYTSKDGTRVPMYLVHKKGTPLDGNRPTLLTGYGGFNVPMLPAFGGTAILWADLGGVWARPNLRGGSEFGEDWHRSGMLDKKQNVFDDFIAAAEWLVANHYTSPSHLAIQGASNGGLLMGAALTQRPGLFRAVVCGYPDLDMVRYYRYTRNNNPPALLEYGDGSNPKHFPFLRSWSPYERVTEGAKYPAVLFTTGEGDTRVPPQQAVKMAARLQWATRSGRPILLRFDRRSGHAGGRTLDEIIRDSASEQAFLLEQLNVKIP